jgi:hypothetical protein
MKARGGERRSRVHHNVAPIASADLRRTRIENRGWSFWMRLELYDQPPSNEIHQIFEKLRVY